MRLRTRGGEVEVGVLATDYDRTLTGPDLRPDPAALEALCEASEAGMRIVVATGRSRWGLPPEVRAVADALVLEGGVVLEDRDGTVRTLAPPGWSGAVRDWLQAAGLAFEAKEAAFSIAAADEGRLAGCPVEVAVQRNHDRTDLAPPGIDKGHGLALLLGPQDGVLAVGDGPNDVPLLLAARHRVAVQNAVPELKAVAHEVTAHPGGEGVARFVRRRLLGGEAPEATAWVA